MDTKQPVSKWRRVRKLAIATTINSYAVYCAYAVVFESNNGGPLNVVRLWCWTHFVLSLLLLLMKRKQMAKMASGIETPEWLSHAFDLAMAGILCWGGFMFYAVAMLMSAMFSAMVYDAGRNPGEPEAEKT